MDRNEFNKYVDRRPIIGTMHLYHGSKNGIQGKIVPDFRLARRSTDFGRGFYLSDDPTHAKALICGRDEYSPVFYKADIDLTGLSCVRVDGLPWALLIAYDRGLLDGYKGTALYKQVADIMDGQDVIIGPIADDCVSLVLEDLFNGTMTDAALIACMEQLRPGTQYAAKTQAACDRISITGTFPLRLNEVKALRAKGAQHREEGIEIIGPVKKQYRRIGDYFDEILEKGGGQLAVEHHTAPPVHDAGRPVRDGSQKRL